ncbi:MFS transporter, SP family, sugar:H+ symporter [Fonsecaea pedrosoi]|nr:MFS transporter, SP family, sugar:H+ symporter [Fonsecaea pedrosoi]
MRMNWKNFGVCSAISSGMLCFAYPSSILASTIGQPAFLDYMGLLDGTDSISPHGNTLIGAFTGIFQVKEFPFLFFSRRPGYGWLTSSTVQAGSVFGVIMAGYVMEKWGRKTAMIVCSVISIISGAILTASLNPAMFMVFRFFTGLGSWGFLCVTPVYTSELAQPEYRGLMVGMNGVMIGLGYSIASYVGLGFFYSTNVTAQWRGPLGLALFFPILMLLMLWFIPESPRYLLMARRPEEAWQIVSDLHKIKGDTRAEYARTEFFQMQKQVDIDREMNCSWWEMIRRPSYRKRAVMGATFAFLGQSSGATVITNYGTIIYRALGYGPRDQLIFQCGWISVAIFGNLGGAIALDYFGRKSLMLWAFIGCLVCLVIEAAMVALYADTGENKAGLGVAVAATYMFAVFYDPGIDANSAVFFSEIFPNHIRPKGATICYVVFALTDLVYLQVGPTAFQNIGYRFYIVSSNSPLLRDSESYEILSTLTHQKNKVFIVLMAVAVVWCWFLVPETKGMPLEEVAAIFGDADEVAVYLRDVHLDPTNDQLVVEHHDGKGGDSIEKVSELHEHMDRVESRDAKDAV